MDELESIGPEPFLETSQHFRHVVVGPGHVEGLAALAARHLLVAEPRVDLSEHLSGDSVIGVRPEPQPLRMADTLGHDLHGEGGVAGLERPPHKEPLHESLVIGPSHIIQLDAVLDSQTPQVDEKHGDRDAIQSLARDHHVGEQGMSKLRVDPAFEQRPPPRPPHAIQPGVGLSPPDELQPPFLLALLLLALLGLASPSAGFGHDVSSIPRCRLRGNRRTCSSDFALAWSLRAPRPVVKKPFSVLDERVGLR